MTSTASPTRPHLTSRRVRRTATVVATTAAALLLGPGVASAHVSITTEPAAPGSYSTVGFRVPNESDTAATTTVEIQLPADSPFSFVSAQQAPGWTISTTETTFPEPVTVGAVTVDKAVTTVTFTADGAGLAPHEFTVFSLLLGPIPDVDSLTFGAIQTYDDGEVVSWTDPTPASGAEPAHPAPVLDRQRRGHRRARPRWGRRRHRRRRRHDHHHDRCRRTDRGRHRAGTGSRGHRGRPGRSGQRCRPGPRPPAAVRA